MILCEHPHGKNTLPTGTARLARQCPRCTRWARVATGPTQWPMTLALQVELNGADDAHLFVGIEKWSNGRYVPFEGSYGFGRDRLADGRCDSPNRRGRAIIHQARSSLSIPVTP